MFERELFLAMRGVYYISNRLLEDPEIEYYGNLYNYWDVVDAMIDVLRSFDKVALGDESDDNVVWDSIVRLNYRTKLMIFKEAIYSIQGY